MFKLLRFYSVISFVIIFITAALLTLFFRHISLQWIEHLSQRDNLAMAKAILNSVEPELEPYLKIAGQSSGRDAARNTGFATEIPRMMKDTTVDRIKIYDRYGQVFYSTKADQTGGNERLTPGFQAAIEGRVYHEFTDRGTFNRSEETYEEDALMHTYIPIRDGPAGPVLGALEIHSNLNELVHENNEVLLIVLAGAETILAILYFILLFVVYYARNIIEAQHKTIQERTLSLENVSKQLLQETEKEKQKLAFDLHEGLAQTLSAIKVRVECNKVAVADSRNEQQAESIVPVLQSAIREVRDMATELRPSSLDSLGLLPAINGFCREFETKHSRIGVKREIAAAESEIPPQLKIDIFRIIQLAFKEIARYSSTDQIRLSVRCVNRRLEMVICDSPLDRVFVDTLSRFDSDPHPHTYFGQIKERTLLSGGTFLATQNNSGWHTLCATWPC